MRHSRVQAMEELEKAMQGLVEAAATRFAQADTGIRIVGPQEIATLHCSPTSTAWRWKGRRRLPDPTWSVSGHDMWDLDVIEQWSRQTGRWHPAVRRWAEHLDRMVRVAGTDLRVPDPSLDFAELYDLLGLGREKTRLAEVGMPPGEASDE